MTTIKDVAEMAQVSVATVSRVINQTGYVSPELDVRVRQAVENLNYSPNNIAKNLRRSNSPMLGVLIPDNNNPFFAEITKGIEDVCFDKGYNVVVCNSDEKSDKAASYLETLYRQRVAGFIVVAPGHITDQLQRLLNHKVPVALADRPLADLAADTVIADHYDGAKQAIEHLIGLGHRRIGLIAGRRELETTRLRWKGVQDALHGAGLSLQDRFIFEEGDFQPGSGYKGAADLLNQRTPPTAIFAFNDLMAFGVLYYASQHGIVVPTQLSVVGFDDTMLASFVPPGLTTVAQPKYELGQTVARVLLNRIRGEKKPPIYHILPTQLVIRGSTAAHE
jgi:LacI family transcriptional regulator